MHRKVINSSPALAGLIIKFSGDTGLKDSMHLESNKDYCNSSFSFLENKMINDCLGMMFCDLHTQEKGI